MITISRIFKDKPFPLPLTDFLREEVRGPSNIILGRFMPIGNSKFK